MYRFAICDDNEQELKKTEEMLNDYMHEHTECPFWVHTYLSFEALLFDLGEQLYFDLLLLDIYMPGKNGIDGARELREKGYEMQIIFLTTSTEHAMEAFNVDAAQYLIKPIERVRFFAVLSKVLGKANEERSRYLAFRTDGEVRRIAFRNIVYGESQNHYQLLHLAGGDEILTRMTLAELYETLGAFPDFVRVGSTYIVNLGYVDILNAKLMKLSTGKEIWLPRSSYAALKEQYFAFYRGEKEELT